MTSDLKKVNNLWRRMSKPSKAASSSAIRNILGHVQRYRKRFTHNEDPAPSTPAYPNLTSSRRSPVDGVERAVQSSPILGRSDGNRSHTHGFATSASLTGNETSVAIESADESPSNLSRETRLTLDRLLSTAAQSMNSPKWLLQSTNFIPRFRENRRLVKKDGNDETLVLEVCRRACEHAATEVNIRRAAWIFRDDMWAGFPITDGDNSSSSLSCLVNALIRLYPVARLALTSSSDVVSVLVNFPD